MTKRQQLLKDLIRVAKKHNVVLHACSCCEGFTARQIPLQPERHLTTFMSVGPQGATCAEENIGEGPW